jgi:TolA-binding protein
MSEIAIASINTFGISPKADFEPPSEEAVFILTASQIQKIIRQAIQPLQDRMSSLEERIDHLEAENATMRLKMASVESLQETDINRICLDIAHDRQRLARLEARGAAPAPTAPPQGEKTLARVAKIDEVLKSRGPTTLTQLEHILGICKATMTRLLGKLDMRRYELHARPGDAREKVLRLKAQIR